MDLSEFCVECNPNSLKRAYEMGLCANHSCQIRTENMALRERYLQLEKSRIPQELLQKIEMLENAVHKFIDINTEIRTQKNNKINLLRNRLSKKIKEEILTRDKYTCQNCGQVASVTNSGEFHIDHIKPICLGGTNEKSNLQVLCKTCNLHKAAYNFESLKKKNMLKVKQSESSSKRD